MIEESKTDSEMGFEYTHIKVKKETYGRIMVTLHENY